MFNALDVLRNYQDSQSERESRRTLAELAQRKFIADQELQPGRMEEQRLSNLAKNMAIQNYGPELQRKQQAEAQAMQLKRDALAAQERIAGMRRGGIMMRPQVIQTENGPMTLGPDNRAIPILGPDGRPVQAKTNEKALPTSAAQKLMENQQNLRRAEQAQALVEGNSVTDDKGNVIAQGDKEATGNKALMSAFGVLGDKALNFLDAKGVDTRAAIGNLGSMIIHDRSGAAVTASEYPRLRPFIPLATDAPDVARRKAAQFANEYRNIQQEMTDFYRESGYKVPTGALRGSGVQNTGGASGDFGEPPAGAVRRRK